MFTSSRDEPIAAASCRKLYGREKIVACNKAWLVLTTVRACECSRPSSTRSDDFRRKTNGRSPKRFGERLMARSPTEASASDSHCTRHQVPSHWNRETISLEGMKRRTPALRRYQTDITGWVKWGFSPKSQNVLRVRRRTLEYLIGLR